MTAFLIIEIEKIRNLPKYYIYLNKVEEIVLKFDGEYLVKSDKVIPFSGDWQPEKLIVIKFPSVEKLKECFNSKDYLVIKPFREMATNGRAVIIEE